MNLSIAEPFRLVFLLLMILVNLPTLGQNCMTYQEMESSGFSMEALDSEYENAIHPDDESGPFEGRQKEFHEAWVAFIAELMKFFGSEGLVWGKATPLHMRVYFQPDGNIDHWFYNFLDKESVPLEKQKRFESLVKKFMKDHKINISTDRKFSQCVGIPLWDWEDGDVLR